MQSTTQRKLKIFLMTKNEDLFVDAWIRYHGLIFGFENIHIIDGSTKEHVFAIYRKYENRGLNVFHSDANLNELENVINEQMHRHKGENSFLIKLDTDEFLAHRELSDWNGLRQKFADRIERFLPAVANLMRPKFALMNNKFDDMLGALPVTGQRYEITDILFSNPLPGEVTNPFDQITNFRDLPGYPRKSFFHSESFHSTDLGGHLGRTTNNSGVIESPLALIHYHNIGVENTVRSAKQTLISHQYIDRDDDLRTAKAKLVELEKKKNYSSHHKVKDYLAYLVSIESGVPLDPEMFYDKFQGQKSKNPCLDCHLVKDTLDSK